MAALRGIKRRVVDVSGAWDPRGVWLLYFSTSDPPPQPFSLRAGWMTWLASSPPTGRSLLQHCPFAVRNVKRLLRLSTLDCSPLRGFGKGITSYPTPNHEVPHQIPTLGR